MTLLLYILIKNFKTKLSLMKRELHLNRIWNLSSTTQKTGNLSRPNGWT
jgi:hypothetical protein